MRDKSFADFICGTGNLGSLDVKEGNLKEAEIAVEKGRNPIVLW